MPNIPVVLYVDDDEDDIALFSDALKEMGKSYKLHVAKNGDDGIKKLMELDQKGMTPCLVVLDINMPRLNGKEVVLRLEKSGRLDQVTVAILTTSNSLAENEFFNEHNIKMFTKPFSFTELVSILQRIISVD